MADGRIALFAGLRKLRTVGGCFDISCVDVGSDHGLYGKSGTAPIFEIADSVSMILQVKPVRAVRLYGVYARATGKGEEMLTKRFYDGGGFAMFISYHDYRLPHKLVGPLHTDHTQFRKAFMDFAKALSEDPNWRQKFDRVQVEAIEAALETNGPRIKGFVWHHHQDHGVLQLVSTADHERVRHYGGRFTTGGRPRARG